MNQSFQNICRVAGTAEEAVRKLTGKNMVLVEQWFIAKTRWHFGNIVKALEYLDWYIAKKKFAQRIMSKNFLDK